MTLPCFLGAEPGANPSLKPKLCVPQMCRQEAVLRPGGGLSAVWRAGSRSEEPLPVPGPAGRGEGAGWLERAGPDRRRDPAVAEPRRTGVNGEGKT